MHTYAHCGYRIEISLVPDGDDTTWESLEESPRPLPKSLGNVEISLFVP